MKLKEDLLSHTSAELNYGLTHFVNEIRRPNGENYAPDSIYFLCLGIQEVSGGCREGKWNCWFDCHTFQGESGDDVDLLAGAILRVMAVTRNAERLLHKSRCRKLSVEKMTLHTHPETSGADWSVVVI